MVFICPCSGCQAFRESELRIAEEKTAERNRRIEDLAAAITAFCDEFFVEPNPATIREFATQYVQNAAIDPPYFGECHRECD